MDVLKDDGLTEARETWLPNADYCLTKYVRRRES